MEGGRLQQFAPPQDVYREPANRFVASFIGTPGMNLIDGELRQQGGTWWFEAPELKIEARGLGPSAQAGKVCLGIRPESITLGTGPYSGAVQLVEQTGHENIVAVNIGGDIRLTGRAPATVIPRFGETIQFSIDPDASHFFAAGPAGIRLNVPRSAESADKWNPAEAAVNLQEAQL